jgi:hypothetical protein
MLDMIDIEDLGSAIVVKVQDTENYKSPFWESFTWKFAEVHRIEKNLHAKKFQS